MLKKLLKMMKDAKGFTLVELLAVIVILGIIAAIAVPSIGGLISNTEERATEAEETVIEEAARLAYTTNGGTFYESDGETETNNISVSELIDQGYLDDSDNSISELSGHVTHSDGAFTYSPDDEPAED